MGLQEDFVFTSNRLRDVVEASRLIEAATSDTFTHALRRPGMLVSLPEGKRCALSRT
jgi:hypothetical protein